MTDGASFWDRLDPKYRLILCDVWGVLHDGARLYPGAEARLRAWRGEGRCVVLLTNAPRPADVIERHLERLGLTSDSYDFIASSGEAGVAALNRLTRPVGFVGTLGDRQVLEARGVAIAAGDEFTDLACVGLKEGRPNAEQYRAELERWAARRVRMHCLNPDRVVMYDGVPQVCAGALADIYEALGGQVTWYGKPYEPIYDHVLDRAGNPPKDQVLAIGDGLQTDMLGAARMGFDAIYISGGINAGGRFPGDFAARYGIAWTPIAEAESLL